MASDRRRKQIASTIRHALQEVFLRHLSDPRIRGMISVTDIEISRDLREALVKVSIFPEKYESVTIHGLQAATMRIQKLVNKQLAIRQPPHLRFELDQMLKKQSEVLAAINSAVASDESNGDEQADEDPDHSNDEQSEESTTEH